MNIAIDGPAGAGKSTIARLLAKKLHFVYVDTGAMYRAMAYHFLKKGLRPEDQEGIAREAASAHVTIRHEQGEQQVYLNGENVTPFLRTEETGNMASASSVYPEVRKELTALQKKLAEEQSTVMDGRDIGTKVLPKAEVKIYLTASTETRARRRYEELLQKGEKPDLSAIERDIEERDYRDMNREEAPLRKAEDAVEVDSSELSVEEVLEKILSVVREREKRP